MPTAPAVRATYSGGSVNTTTNPKTVAISWQAGDVVLVVAAEGGAGGFTAPTCAGLTFAQAATIGTAGSVPFVTAWAATAAAAGSDVLSVGYSRTGYWTYRAWVYSSSSGVGATAVSGSTAHTISLVRATANSVVVEAWSDYGGNPVGTLTWTPTGATQRDAAQQTGWNLSWGAADWGDQGAVATKSYGVSAGISSTAAWGKVAVEIKPATAAATVPGAPTAVSATAGDTQATVSFTAPTSTGGSAIDSYRVTSSPGGLTATGAGSPLTVTGLTNGTAYTFTVAAHNAVGYSPESSASTPVTPAAPTSGHLRFYADTSCLNTPIPASPVIDTSSATWVSALNGAGGFSLNVLGYASPIVYADGTETTYDVPTTHDSDWGDAIPASRKMPLRSTWKPSPGTDGWLIVVSADRTYGWWVWQYTWNGGSPRGSWGGSGQIGSTSNPPTTPWVATGGGNGSGLSELAGAITAEDLAAGSINHALVFCSPQSGSTFRSPATKTDGSHSVPEGVRIQLDPSINVDAQSGWSVLEKMVAKALQTYGAYLNDTGGGNAFLGQMDQNYSGTDPGPIWHQVGVFADYPSLSHIPWSSLRVLAHWNGV